MSIHFSVCFIILAVGCLIYLLGGLKEYIDEQENRARWALQNWREANPDYYIGEWPYAQQLILDRIVTYELWFIFHPEVRRSQRYIDHLVKLLHQGHPPLSPPPRRERLSQSNGPKSWAVFSYQKIPISRDFIFYCLA